MATVETLTIDVKASVDKAVSSLKRVKGSLSSVSGESKSTTKTVKETALAFESTADGVAKAAKALANAGYKNVSKEVARMSKHLKASGIKDLTAAMQKQADEFEAKGDKQTADLLRERSNPAARESEILGALKEQRDAEKAVADEIKRKKELEKEAAKAFADGEKLIKDIVKKQEQEKRDAATKTWRDTQDLLKRQAIEERKAASEAALSEKNRHNKEMENLKQQLVKQRETQFEVSQAAKQKAKADKDAEAAAKRRAKEEENLTKELQKQEDAKKAESERKNAASLKQLEKSFKGLSSILPNLEKRLFGVFRMFGRIAMYRAVRAAIKALTAAIKEGLTNLKAYSQEVGTAFAPAVDNLRSHVLWLKNAFATALRPVLEALMPLIQRLVDWLVKAADFMAQVFSIMTGKVDANGRYTKAVLTDIQESNKEAKKLQRTLLGFDEINRLDDNSSTDTTPNAGLMFTQADVSDKAIEWAERLTKWFNKIKEIIANTDWEMVLKVLAALKLAQILSKVVGWIKSIGALLSGTGGVLAVVLAIVAAFALWGDKISAFVEKAIPHVERFFNKLKNKVEGSQWLTDLITMFGDFVKYILEAIGHLASAIHKLFHGDFKGALDDGIKFLKSALKAVVAALVGLLNTIILPLFSAAVNALASAWTWLHNKVWAPAVNTVATAFENARRWLHNAFIDLRIAVNSVLKWILERVNDALQWILDGINAAIESFNEVFGTNLRPIEFKIDTTFLDEKIEELKKTKLPPLEEKLEVVGQWRAPEKLKLHVDASDAYALVDRLFEKVTKLGAAVSSVVTTLGGEGKNRANMVKYASGGFPSMGTIFVAGEAGAEYVTDINGRTGVYNTDQMANAMYKAMVAALSTMPQQGGGDIYLDGEKIYTAVVRRNNNHVRSTGRAALLT